MLDFKTVGKRQGTIDPPKFCLARTICCGAMHYTREATAWQNSETIQLPDVVNLATFTGPLNGDHFILVVKLL